MNRVCMRPGCDRPADARISYDAVRCEVWLDHVPKRLGPVQEICDFHAQRLTVPRGWNLSDLRLVAQVAQPSEVSQVVPESSQVVQESSQVVEPPAGLQMDPPTRSPIASSPRVAKKNAPGGLSRLGDGPDQLRSKAAPNQRGAGRYEPTSELSRRRHPANTARELFADDPLSTVAPEFRSSAMFEEGETISPAVGHSEAGSRVVDNSEAGSRVVDNSETGSLVVEESEVQFDDEATPSSPLLARAFDQIGPQHSVLSDVMLGREPPTEG